MEERKPVPCADKTVVSHVSQFFRALSHFSSFRNTPNGMPGNSDAGSLNSWLIWQMLGLYPIVTTPVYLLESPWFRDINMTINGNKTLRILAEGLGDDSYYVQGVKVSGVQWD